MEKTNPIKKSTFKSKLSTWKPLGAVHRSWMTRKRGQNLSSLHPKNWETKKLLVWNSVVVYYRIWVWRNTKRRTFGQKIATAFWAPKATKPEAPHETLLTTLLHPAPINTLFTSTSPPPIDILLPQKQSSQGLLSKVKDCVFAGSTMGRKAKKLSRELGPF